MAVRAEILFVLFGILWLVSVCNSVKGSEYGFMKEAREAAAKAHYDYIIVGGGTAGCPLAATLSQNFSVLLLERGGSPYGNTNISRIENFHRSLLDVDSPWSPAQEFISEDGVISARGRVLGGGSCLNAGFYSRAGRQDIRDFGWDARLVKQSFTWVEKIVAHRPRFNPWQSAIRGGLLEVGIAPDNGFTYDHVYGTKLGGTTFNKTGDRSTAADLLRYANPHKLTVLLRAPVHRILFTAHSGESKPRARGVVFRDADGSKHVAYLKKKGGAGGGIVVSAGALGSPQLLMLSGIGPAHHLRSLGIPVLLDQPWVGGGMADNPMNAIFVPSPIPVELSLIQVVGITKFGTYIEASSGFGATTVAQCQGGYVLEKVLGPLSSGRLYLRNTNVDENPSVRFNYFQHPRDLKRCVSGIKTIEKVIKSRHLRRFTYPNMSLTQLLNITAQAPINNIPRHRNDATSLEQFCKDTVSTIWHYHGGCQVGRVVDRNYRVVGVDGLRVIDGSTLLFSPGTNPQATVMMLGRYMGVKILRERLGAAARV